MLSVRVATTAAAVVLAAAGTWLSGSGVGTAAQAPTYTAPRFVDGNPDLNGIWQALGTAHWDLEAHHARPGPLQFGALTWRPITRGRVLCSSAPCSPSPAD